MQARASFKGDGIKIDCLVATKVSVIAGEYRKAMKNVSYYEKWVKTPDGKDYAMYMTTTAKDVANKVASGIYDIKTIKAMMKGERTDNMPAYFDEFFLWCIDMYKRQRGLIADGQDANEDFLNNHKDGEPLTESSIRLMEKSYNVLAKYMKHRNTPHVAFAEITSDFLSNYNIWLKANDYAANSRKQHMARIITIAHIADKYGKMDSHRLRAPKVETKRDADALPVVLTAERLQQMIDAKDLPLPLEQARDVFALGCMVGQRFSDYHRLSLDDIISIDGHDFFKIRQRKTSTTVRIPVDERARVILKRNGGHLPTMSLSSLNVRIKNLGATLGWNEKVLTEVEKNGVKALVKVPFFSLLGSHSARRTMATLALEAGDSLGTIATWTGHESETSLKKYLCLDEKEKAAIAINSKYYQSIVKEA